MATSILDESLIPAYPRAYTLWINNYRAIEQEARIWYKQSTGRDPADSDLAHGLWRALNEGERWGTLRRAFQETWPLPVTYPTPLSSIQADFLDNWSSLSLGRRKDERDLVFEIHRQRGRNV